MKILKSKFERKTNEMGPDKKIHMIQESKPQ